MRLLLAQLNPLVGDLQGNANKILNACRKGNNLKADLVATPELSLWGYPPKDLLFNPTLLKAQNKILENLSKTLREEQLALALLVGIAETAVDNKLPNLFNAVALIEQTGWRVIARKQLLPSYDVFDEKRYFRAGDLPGVLDYQCHEKRWRIGITICEDLWVEEQLQGPQLRGPDPIEKLTTKCIDILINLSASPFSQSKEIIRKGLVAKAANRLHCPVVYLNQVGANDELIFDGGSFVVTNEEEVSLELPSYQEAISLWDSSTTNSRHFSLLKDSREEIFKALILGVHDYSTKCGFSKALVGLSGGIDSALVAVIATAALGHQNVKGILMPSPWSSKGSVTDAYALAERLGITTRKIPIKNLMESFELRLVETLGEELNNIAAENLQARIRGTLLMALANQQGELLLSTGNKSELAVGYCTLYGDMNGGLSVIGDLYKTSVFDLCAWIDSKVSKDCREKIGLPANIELIGRNIRNKSPSAELRANQLDSDSLPDYADLDPILKALIEERLSPEELVKRGHNPTQVSRIHKMLRNAEFKRHQAPPLLKVSPQAFGSGWRKPIAAS